MTGVGWCNHAVGLCTLYIQCTVYTVYSSIILVVTVDDVDDLRACTYIYMYIYYADLYI